MPSLGELGLVLWCLLNQVWRVLKQPMRGSRGRVAPREHVTVHHVPPGRFDGVFSTPMHATFYEPHQVLWNLAGNGMRLQKHQLDL